MERETGIGRGKGQRYTVVLIHALTLLYRFSDLPSGYTAGAAEDPEAFFDTRGPRLAPRQPGRPVEVPEV